MFTYSPPLCNWQRFSYRRVRTKAVHGSLRVGESDEALAALRRTARLTADALVDMSVCFVSNCTTFPEPFMALLVVLRPVVLVVLTRSIFQVGRKIACKQTACSPGRRMNLHTAIC